MVNPRLLVVVGVLLAVAIGVWIWSAMGGGNSGAIAKDGQDYHCCFDDTVVTVANRDLLPMRNQGEAVLGAGPGSPPTRVKCTECDRMSCFTLDPATGEEIEIDPSWDLENTDSNPRTDGNFR